LEAAPIQLLLVSRIERLAGLFFGLIEESPVKACG
jgi:hypothetical protein